MVQSDALQSKQFGRSLRGDEGRGALEALRRNDRSELTLRVNNYSDAICHYHAANAGDKCRFLRSLGTNSNPVGLTSYARISNIDIVIACDEI